MHSRKRKSGLHLIGDLPWGSHFCQLSRTTEDLLELLVPYFQAGLESNEFCLWVTSESVGDEESLTALHNVAPEFAGYADKGQLEVIPYSRWRFLEGTPGGAVDSMLNRAASRGFEGLRLACNASPEEMGNKPLASHLDIGGKSVIAAFAYSRDEFDALGLMELVKSHRFALVRNAGKWEVVEGSEARILREELKKSEEMYRSLFENMLNGFAYCRMLFEDERPVDFVYLAVNGAFEKLTGLRDVVGKRVSEVIPGIRESDPGLLDTYGRVARSGVPERFEVYVDALKMWFSISVYSPKAEHFVAVFDVITERKHAEDALRASEEQFRTLADSIPNLAWWANGDGYITWYNQRWYDYTGTTPEQMEGWGWQSVHDPEVLPSVMERWQTSIATGRPFDMVFPLRGADGILRPFLTRVMPVFDQDGQIVRWFGTNTDITERKQAEDALRESEEKYRTLFESIDQGFCTIEVLFDEKERPVDYRFLVVNPAFERQTGILNSAGRRMREIAPLHEEHWFRIYGDIAITGEARRFENVAEQLNRYYEVFAWKIGAPEERNVAILFNDITERKQAEEALKKAHTELAEQMEERVKELREKEVLLKEVHHRVKNNLQVISSLVGMQSDGIEDETVREVLQDVTYRVRSMALVHEKLYQSESLARVDFAEYAQSLLSYLWRAYGAAAETVRLVCDLEPVELPVDTAVPCGLILNELAGNALKHAFRGRSEGEVTVSLHRVADGRISLGVRDDGVGMPAGLEWRQAGSLGLRLVQMLAGQVGAEVAVDRNGGTGFTISFRLKAEG